MIIRDATPADAAACAAIYTPYVTETAISFEHEPPSVAEMAERIAATQATHAWLVLEHDSEVVGYAYGGAYRARPAYRWSTEVSVYMDRGRQRTGGGRALYQALFDRLEARGYRTLVAGMVLPNDASIALHKAMGFELVGTQQRIGWKLGQWRDVTWMLRTVGDDAVPPSEPS